MSSAFLLQLLVVIVCCASCSEQRPQQLPDYDNADGFILDYGVGDKLRTIQPMLLARTTGKELSLHRPGVGVPSIEQYIGNSNAFGYVVSLVPSGTVITVAGIKDAGYHTSVCYVTLPSVDEWVGVTLGEYVDSGGVTRKRYNRDFFEKQP
jgi:hypothetical protein